MSGALHDWPVEMSADGSAIASVAIDGLPEEIDALGRHWQRKLEFHMTVIGAARIAEVGGGDPTVPGRVAQLLARRVVGPIYITRELRRAHHPDEPGFESIVVMVECAALAEVYRELSTELGAELSPPPAHVTLYSTDPERGIGINGVQQLRKRAPALSEGEQDQLRRAMRFEDVFERRARA